LGFGGFAADALIAAGALFAGVRALPVCAGADAFFNDGFGAAFAVPAGFRGSGVAAAGAAGFPRGRRGAGSAGAEALADRRGVAGRGGVPSAPAGLADGGTGAGAAAPEAPVSGGRPSGAVLAGASSRNFA
jgi:hypothetical protein